MTDTPTEADSVDAAALSEPLRRRLERLAPDAIVREIIATGSRVDTGRWLGPAPVMLCVLEEGVALLADGPDPLAEYWPARTVADSIYNHATGELLLAPARGSDCPGLKLDPLAARRVLSLILFKDDQDA
ncbi:MAG: hypothetical protein R3336_00535 [Phycisphaeraceae bacterium]|nr:hypothetical protein [Phycisphaeraceae bacterium]